MLWATKGRTNAFKCYKRGVLNRRGWSDKISKIIQEGGLTNPKSYKRGVSSSTERRVHRINQYKKELFINCEFFSLEMNLS